MASDKLKLFRAKIADTSRALLFGSSLLLGDELGLFVALRGVHEGLSSAELSAKVQADSRYIQEWLTHMLSYGVVSYDDKSGRFILPEEHAVVLADESSPHFATGMVQFGVGCNMIHGKLQHVFKNGGGIQWDDLDERIPNGLRRWFKVNYDHLLVQEWVAKLDPVIVSKLKSGALVADVGCGHGVATLRLAKAFPLSRFIGYDYDPESIRMANEIAKQDNLKNVEFFAAGATDYGREQPNHPQSPLLSSAEHKHDDQGVFDLVCFFAAFHDMSNPGDIVTYTKRVLKSDGFVFLVEPWAGNTLEETCSSPAGALFAGVSVHYCTPCAKTHSQEDNMVMGAVSPNNQYTRLWVEHGGFASLRVVPVENSPNNRVLEVRRQASATQ